MKKLISVLIVLLLMPVSFAINSLDIQNDVFTISDIDMDLELITDGDINANIHCLNGGNCNVQVDGTDYGQRLSEVKSSMYGRYEINKFFARAISILKGTYKYAQSDEDVQLGYTLESYFASDYDLMYAYTMLSHRIETLEYLYKQSEANNVLSYCKGMEHVAIKYNLSGVTCDNTTMVLGDDYMVSITTIHNEEPEGPVIDEVDNLSWEEEIINENIPQASIAKDDYKVRLYQKYTELCERGFRKYCIILEQQGMPVPDSINRSIELPEVVITIDNETIINSSSIINSTIDNETGEI